MFHLILAGLWVFLAVLFLARPWLGLPPLRFTGAGWLCLVLALYNFVRWWARRLSQTNRPQHRLPPRRERDDDRPPDPNFDFSREAITRPEDRPRLPPDKRD